MKQDALRLPFSLMSGLTQLYYHCWLRHSRPFVARESCDVRGTSFYGCLSLLVLSKDGTTGDFKKERCTDLLEIGYLRVKDLREKDARVKDPCCSCLLPWGIPLSASSMSRSVPCYVH